MNHTPPPWKVVSDAHSKDHRKPIYIKTDRCRHLRLDHPNSLDGDLIARVDFDLEDAAFIVQAVNSHAALVEALKELVNAVHFGNGLDEKLNKSRAVLALAERTP